MIKRDKYVTFEKDRIPQSNAFNVLFHQSQHSPLNALHICENLIMTFITLKLSY